MLASGPYWVASSYSSFSAASACPIDLGRPNTAPGAATSQASGSPPLCLHRRSSKWIHDFLVWRPILLNLFFLGIGRGHWPPSPSQTLITQLISEHPFVDGPGQWLCTANVSFFRTPTSKIKAGKGGVYGILLFILLQFMDESAYKHPIVELNLNFWRHLDRQHWIWTYGRSQGFFPPVPGGVP